MKSFVLAAATIATFAIFGLGNAEAGHCNVGRGYGPVYGGPVYGGPVYGRAYGPIYSTPGHYHGHGHGIYNHYPSYGRGHGYGAPYRGYRGSSFGISTPSFGLYVR